MHLKALEELKPGAIGELEGPQDIIKPDRVFKSIADKAIEKAGGQDADREVVSVVRLEHAGRTC